MLCKVMIINKMITIINKKKKKKKKMHFTNLRVIFQRNDFFLLLLSKINISLNVNV